ncbi:B12-binding domain-containing radical SAM protein [Sporosarcina thermotolerans]|uniref:B12-binding domain-containing radical SAM protein n=1 Tax=Sporosarcina thermotolerans TaxID=633404 RepID=UPI0024BD18A3|nr:B12-binding domain-containing radical SAM protein [Sporosarcina thermotolerans]WHT46866.1 B12-binding domain-containing radical SAM protein [Sporosarcina thermotolerans]
MNIVLTTLNAKYIHTNLAIRYLKSYVMPDYEPILSEYTIKDPILNIVADIHQKKPKIVGFSLYIWNIEESIKVIRILKKTNPELVIVAGGPEVTYDYDKWLEKVPEIDFIAIGEGERTFKQLLDYHAGKIQLSEVQGIAYNIDDKLKITAPGPKLDLREIPSPFRFPEDVPHLSSRVTYIETSRGCPFSCQFCLSSIEVGVRYFNRETVKDDIRYLMKNGAKTIKFVDRTFNISRSYAMEMFRFLIDEYLPGTVFQFEITGDIMRPEVINFLNENAPKGLFRFEIGIQSTNDLTNELVKRRQNFEKLSRTVTMVKEGGKIAQHLDLIAGLPEEDYDSFRKTFNDVFAMRPEELQLGFLKLLRGTGLRIQAEQYGYTYIDEAPYEILSNNVLTFDEILRIKQTEDVLEKYWNDNRMPRTIEYLVSEVFETPFDFFQEFGTFWELSGWSRIGHQLQDLYTRLESFLLEFGKADMEIVQSLMKIDYLAHHTFQPRHIWWKDDFDADTLTGIERLILNDAELLERTVTPTKLTERNIRKHTFITPVAIRPNETNENEFIKEDGYLVTFFCRGQEPQFHFLAKKLMNA